MGKRCYVGNLAWKTSWQDLKDKFRECGQVVYANVMRDDDGEAVYRCCRGFNRCFCAYALWVGSPPSALQPLHQLHLRSLR